MLVETLEQIGAPCRTGLEKQDAQAREALEDTATDDRRGREHDIERELERVERRVRIDEALVAEARASRVEPDRNVELLGKRKDRIVLRVVGVPLEHGARHGDRHEPELGDRAARLVERVGHRSQRERRASPSGDRARRSSTSRASRCTHDSTRSRARDPRRRRARAPRSRRAPRRRCPLRPCRRAARAGRPRLRASARPRGCPRGPTHHDRSPAGRGALRAGTASCRGRRGRAGDGGR